MRIGRIVWLHGAATHSITPATAATDDLPSQLPTEMPYAVSIDWVALALTKKVGFLLSHPVRAYTIASHTQMDIDWY